jgi:tRNA G18 (ribose-2'-O)-methylase SpoU
VALARIAVDDPLDPRLRDFTDLTDVALRSAREPTEGLFIAEGEKTIRRAVAAGFVARSVLTSERWLDALRPVLEPTEAAVYVADEQVLAAVTGYPVHRGALASFTRRPLPPVTELVRDAETVLVLEDLTDHTNVGLVFRTAAALRFDAAVLSPRCADPLYRRAIRTSMGAVLSLPYARMTNWYTGLSDLRAAGHHVLALTPDPAATPLDDALARTPGRVALVLGAEGPGMSQRWLKESDERVRIPMATSSDALRIDSLNVAAAAAIACYLVGRRS